MAAVGQELLESFERKWNRIGTCHADGVKTLRARGIGKRNLQRSRIL